MSNNQATSQFFTRQVANEGVDLPLHRPDGSLTDHKIRIRGIDSDAFRKARSDANRRIVDLAAMKDEGERDAAITTEKLNLVAALVVSWTFKNEDGTDYPCTPENVKAFLSEAPQIADSIDELASRRSLFFKNGGKHS